MGSRLLEELLGIQFFGEYLIDRWIITREQLLEALDYQMKRNERFGTVAVRRKYLTQEQIKTINERQRQTDRTFGEMAVDLQYLTTDQVREILTIQRKNNIYLGDVLLRLGFVTEDVLRRELKNYRDHQNRFLMDDVEFVDHAIDRELVAAGVDMTRKLFRRVAGLVVKVGRPVRLDHETEVASLRYTIAVQVPFKNGTGSVYVLAVTGALAQRIAKSLLGEGDDTDNPVMVADAVKEFCNIVCGNTVAKLAKKGFEVSILPPSSAPEMPEPPAGFRAVTFPVRALEGGAEVRFFVPAESTAAASASPKP